MKMGKLDLGRQRILIAEIGNNHEGDPVLAMELAEAAIDAGADVVKLQLIDPPRMVNIAHTDRIQQLSRFRLKREDFAAIGERVRSRGRVFMASIFDCDTLAAFHDLLDVIKIASGDLNFDQMLATAAQFGKPIILSTGMSTLPEIHHAVEVVRKSLPEAVGLTDTLALLHCVSLYPTAEAQANLSAIPHMAKALNLAVGYSDHTMGLTASTIALALGARIIEKHFTLNKQHSAFRDHALSAEPAELKRLAEIVHGIDAMLGNGERDALPDAATRELARRSIVAIRPLKAGTVLQVRDFDFIRPANGFPPGQAEALVGRRLLVDAERHHVFQREDIG